MSQATATASSTGEHVPTEAREQAKIAAIGPWGWARANLFGSVWSTAVSLALGYIIVRVLFSLIEWGLVNAIWTVPYGPSGIADTASCQNAKGVGACWAVLADKYRLILFGRYPVRPAMATRHRRAAVHRPVCCLRHAPLLAQGARADLDRHPGHRRGVDVGRHLRPDRKVTEDYWGGLPITLILATFGAAFSFPLAILVALGRRSTKLPAVKMLCVLYVELIRGVPLIAVLFMASVMFPLFMPAGVNVDKLLRAQIAFILFAGAYLAEVVRGGLQALPKGQAEAADALGLSYWKKTAFIILPQALRLVIPPLVNTFIGFFKDTSLVLIIGLFDLLTMGKVALSPTRPGRASRPRSISASRHRLHRVLLCHVEIQPQPGAGASAAPATR